MTKGTRMKRKTKKLIPQSLQSKKNETTYIKEKQRQMLNNTCSSFILKKGYEEHT